MCHMVMMISDRTLRLINAGYTREVSLHAITGQAVLSVDVATQKRARHALCVAHCNVMGGFLACRTRSVVAYCVKLVLPF